MLIYKTDQSEEFAPGDLLVEYENPKNLGYAHYLNDISEAFFTISQKDAKANIRRHVGTAHVVIIRNAEGYQDVVWRGILAEIDANQEDVIFYAYGYEAQLYTLHTKWNQRWKNTEIGGASGCPVDDLWARAVALTDSPLGFAATGTIETPTTMTGGNIDLVLQSYRCNHKRILQALRELTAISTSDTNNVVYMEIDYPKDPTDLGITFNYWKDRSDDVTDIRFEYPGNIMGYADRFTPVLMRNKILGVGSGPRNQLYRYNAVVKAGNYGRDAFGMHSEATYLSWVRDRSEMKRVILRRLRLGLREDVDVYVRLFPGTIPPWRATNSQHRLGDRVYTQVVNGITRFGKWMTLMGEQTIFVGGREYVQPILEDRAGAVCPTIVGTPAITEASGTNISVKLPDGKYEAGRHIFIHIAWTYTFDSGFSAHPGDDLEAAGFTPLLFSPTTAKVGTLWRGHNLYYKLVTGDEGYARKGETIAVDMGGDSNVVAVTELLEGIYNESPSNPGLWWTANPNITVGDTDPDPLPAQTPDYSEFVRTRYYVDIVTDGATVTNDPIGYLAFEDDAYVNDGTESIRLRVTRKDGFNVDEDPSPYTCSGSILNIVIRVRGDCD